MDIYEMNPVLENPMFQGLTLSHEELFEAKPSGWHKNYKTWQPNLLKPTWNPPLVTGKPLKFNDYPCINGNGRFPAFSQKAVSKLGDVLAANGELLPVIHEIGTYYYFNCIKMVNCLDLEKAHARELNGGLNMYLSDQYDFIEEMLQDLTIFKIRTQIIELFCTQTFVDIVNGYGLQGFSFTRVWPLPPSNSFANSSYLKERRKELEENRRRKPFIVSNLEVNGNSVVLRLYTAKARITKKESEMAKVILNMIEQVLYIPDLRNSDLYFGNVEDHEIVGKEFRIIISCPDCEVLLARLMPIFRTLPWKGTFDVTKSHYPFTPIIYPDEDENVENVEIL